MRDAEQLDTIMGRIDGRGYKAYKELTGAWRFPTFTLHVDHVQGDPFAAPTRVRAVLAPEVAALPASAIGSPARTLGSAAHLARTFSTAAREASKPAGSGKSGEIRMEHPGQVVGAQTAVLLGSAGQIEARFTVGLPADGRRIAGRRARSLLREAVPSLVSSTLPASAHDPEELETAAAVNEDATSLRAQLDALGYVAFVADGASLPRSSGIDDRPLTGTGVVPFRSPESLAATLTTPNSGPVHGMGIPEGVTLVVGGGFHGKSTLLRALQAGVYNHAPGDGRERVVTRTDAVKIRAEDGRSVAGVDITPFIDGLPMDRPTDRFTTANASGSTSQASAIVEALEVGAGILLVDEDTSATNFMIRDRRMQALVPDEGEPIKPFVDHVRPLHTDSGVSTIVVIGGSGDYLDMADLVIRMADYLPHDVTADARRVAEEMPAGREAVASPGVSVSGRVIDAASLDPRRGRRELYVRVPDDRTLLFGTAEIDLTALEQLHGRSQVRAIGQALALLGAGLLDDEGNLPRALDALDAVLAADGLDALDDRLVGDLAEVRRFEVAAALNRLRSLRVRR